MSDIDGALRTDRLKEHREAHGWSQRELARRCNLAENMIGKYESGLAEPTASNLKVICDILEISIDYLLGVSDQPNRVFSQSDLDEEENKIIQTYRREGWPGVIRLGGEQLSK
jgi:transcriptional regulator with XRE-family HTH domain